VNLYHHHHHHHHHRLTGTVVECVYLFYQMAVALLSSDGSSNTDIYDIVYRRQQPPIEGMISIDWLVRLVSYCARKNRLFGFTTPSPPTTLCGICLYIINPLFRIASLYCRHAQKSNQRTRLLTSDSNNVAESLLIMVSK
jgi:hypothetical protein